MNIADWHQGTRDARGALVLSSRQLLNLVYRLPETSQFKTHAPPPFGRDGDWTDLQKIAAETHNEIAAYRASKYAGTEYEYAYTTFLSPKERLDRAIEEAAQVEFQESAFDGLLGNTFE
ncbi:hypothetical protein [Mycobacteroides chelonae]